MVESPEVRGKEEAPNKRLGKRCDLLERQNEDIGQFGRAEAGKELRSKGLDVDGCSSAVKRQYINAERRHRVFRRLLTLESARPEASREVTVLAK